MCGQCGKQCGIDFGECLSIKKGFVVEASLGEWSRAGC